MRSMARGNPLLGGGRAPWAVQAAPRPAPHSGARAAAARRRRVSGAARAAAAALDSDDYEPGSGYDSDDYDAPAPPPPPPRARARGGDTTAPGAGGGHEYVVWPPRAPRPRLVLLAGAAADRAASRAQAAAARAARAARDAAAFSPLGRALSARRAALAAATATLPPDAWGRLLWLWDRPQVQRLRLTISMANLSIRLPALLALVATQVGLLASQVSLPMLAPLLLGTGMLMRTMRANASFLLPRLGLVVVMLWVLWFANSVVHATVAYLRKQGAVDARVAGGVVTLSEVTALLAALLLVLSSLGVNVSAILLPAGVAVAVAAKDMSHNFLAGFFLFVVQPFRTGDRVAVPYAAGAPGAGLAAGGGGGAWFEGVCERVDLRYTALRSGKRRLMVPNSAFLTREFMVVEDAPPGAGAGAGAPGGGAGAAAPAAPYAYDARHLAAPAGGDYFGAPYAPPAEGQLWQQVHGPPLHAELERELAAGDGGAAEQAPPPPPQQQQPYAAPPGGGDAAAAAPAPRPAAGYYAAPAAVPAGARQPGNGAPPPPYAGGNGHTSGNGHGTYNSYNPGGQPPYWQQQQQQQQYPPSYGGPRSYPLPPGAWVQPPAPGDDAY